jgi:sarcosine oxidase subunit gamma
VTVEPLARTHPLQSWTERFAALPDGVTLLAEPYVAAADLRTDPAGPGAAGVEAWLGAPLPGAGTWTDGRVAATWLGPDEWLLTSPFVTPADLERAARRALGPGAGAVVDVSAQRTTLRLRGVHAPDVLETGCAIDLHPRSFPAGRAVSTTLGGVGVVLAAVGENDYRLLVRASFAAHLAAWLEDAASEHA